MEREKLSILLLSAPAFIVIGIVIAMVGWGIYASFTNQALIGPEAKNPEWVGLRNYFRIPRDPDFWHSIKITWIFTIGSAIAGQCVLGLLLAVILKQRGLKFKAFTALAVLICWVIPDVVGGLIMGAFWHAKGLLNKILSLMGLPTIDWLTEQPLLAIIFANIWRGTGWSLLLFSSALETIPQDYYDAADVDGASSWFKFRTITLPLAWPVIVINLFLITIWTYGYFDIPYIMTRGGPGTATLLYPIYVFREAFSNYLIGYGSALSVVNLLILLPLSGLYLWMLRRWGRR